MKNVPKPVHVGIDVAKESFDSGLGVGGEVVSFTNDVAGAEALLLRLRDLEVRLIVMEATGGYEAELACALQAAGYEVAVVNPRQARDYATLALEHPRLVYCSITGFGQDGPTATARATTS